MLQASQGVKQCGLPRTARTTQKNPLAALNLQVDPMQNFNRLPPNPVAPVQVARLDHHFAHARL
jgi:hypothetical protein